MKFDLISTFNLYPPPPPPPFSTAWSKVLVQKFLFFFILSSSWSGVHSCSGKHIKMGQTPILEDTDLCRTKTSFLEQRGSIILSKIKDWSPKINIKANKNPKIYELVVAQMHYSQGPTFSGLCESTVTNHENQVKYTSMWLNNVLSLDLPPRALQHSAFLWLPLEVQWFKEPQLWNIKVAPFQIQIKAVAAFQSWSFLSLFYIIVQVEGETFMSENSGRYAEQ